MHEHELKILEAGNNERSQPGHEKSDVANTGKHKVGLGDLNIGNIHDTIIGGNVLGGDSSSESVERLASRELTPGKSFFGRDEQKIRAPAN